MTAGSGAPDTRAPIIMPAVCICCGEPSDGDDIMCDTCEHPIFEIWAGCQESTDG